MKLIVQFCGMDRDWSSYGVILVRVIDENQVPCGILLLFISFQPFFELRQL